ncbi:hypothetical protein COLO4_24420 [Corchorus olitorius]|uniref:Uncharacterized protein n=1 Tax=Corchorus olitorius TaxID=93759 RepID=A0A1R3IAA1_9ROSI|nr:hypothetical protein COLO4_24420 [Corchorus olitorius]
MRVAARTEFPASRAFKMPSSLLSNDRYKSVEHLKHHNRSSRFFANPFGQPSQEVTRLKNRVVDLESEVAQIPELKSQVATIPLLEARIDSMMMIIQKHLPYIDILMQSQVGNNTNENVTNPSMPSQTSTHHQGETCKRARKF